MNQILGKYFLEQGELKAVETFYDFTGNPGACIFEVLRVISGVPLFLDDHLLRLEFSAGKLGFGQPVDVQHIREMIYLLISKNQVQTGNIKIVVRHFQHKNSTWAYFIPYKYPSESDYKNGVGLGILQAERTNPEAKTIQPEVRETANKMIQSGGFYEVLLADNQGFIREGSRSNIFFTQGCTVVTPPSETVLNGITRRKIIEILKAGNYTWIEKTIALSDLGSFDSAFLTGTSPKVLPVRRIENLPFNPGNPLCTSIMDSYDRLVEEYILVHR